MRLIIYLNTKNWHEVKFLGNYLQIISLIEIRLNTIISVMNAINTYHEHILN